MVIRAKIKFSIEHAPLKSGISIDAAIAQKWPVRTMLVHTRPIDFGCDNFFAIDGSLGQNFATGRADKTLSPKLDAIAPGWRFMAHTICRGDKATISDGVAALHRLPGGKLSVTIFFLLAWVPANRRRIENNFRSAQRRESRRFRLPLVPANADAEIAGCRFPTLKAEIARGKIKFFVVRRIIRDVHLAIFSEDVAVGIDHYCGIVKNPGRALFEKRRHNDNGFFPRKFCQRFGRRAGNRFG